MVLTKLMASILNSCILYIVAAMICMVILYGPDKAYGLYIEFLYLVYCSCHDVYGNLVWP